LITAVLASAQSAMQHHSRLAQLAAIRELGPHLLHFAQQSDALKLAESPHLYRVLGEYLLVVGKAPEAESCLRHAMQSPLAPQAPSWQIDLQSLLGRACQAQQQFEQAERAYQVAVDTAASLYGTADSRLSPLVENLGQLAYTRGDFPAAVAYYQRTLEIDQAADADANRIASRWNNLGRVYQGAADLSAALACFQQAEILWQTEGVSDHHVNQALALKNMGVVYQQLGQLPQAKDCLERAILLSEGFYGKDHPDIGRDAGLLAGILQEMGDLEGALAQFRRAVRVDRKAFGDIHPEVALNLNNMGVLLAQMGKPTRACETFTEAIRILEQCAAPDHPYRLHAEENLRGCQPGLNSIQSNHAP
jgi:tetratricopeptide (TPR) repeat protein